MSQETKNSVAETESTPLPDQGLFILKKHFTARDIKLAARTEIGRKQLLAFVAGDGDLSLHFLPGEPPDKPVMRLIPWFAEPNKRITCMCFDPSGAWLLIAGYDNSLFIIPALALVDTNSPVDHRWPTDDITIFPPIAGAQGSAGRGAHPSAIVWWQSLLDCTHTAVVASDRGDIAFINLNTGSQIGVTFIRYPILSLHLYQDNSMDMVFLLITSETRDQWRLLLEQSSTSFSWPGDAPASNSELSSSTGSGDLDFNPKIPPTTRSRLQGLKQLSVEKLAILRQRLAETRSRGVMMGKGGGSAKRGLATLLKESETMSNGSGSSSGSEDTGSGGRRNSSCAGFASSGPTPERMGDRVGETFMQPQHARGRHLLSGYFKPYSILTVHGPSMEETPLFVHKLPPNCDDVLLTDRFLFVTNSMRSVTVISCQLSECRIDGGGGDFNPDSIIDLFGFPDEKVVSIFKCTESNYRREETKPVSTEIEAPSKESMRAALKVSHLQQQTREFKPTPVEAPPVDSCVVITSNAMYSIRLRTPAPDVFLELVLKHQALENAERLALVFGLSLQQLLEHAGDLRLASRDFPSAITFYKLSRCRHLKSVLKFAASGHPAELLSYVNVLFSTTGLDLTGTYWIYSEKIHLSNLVVMSYTEQVLRNSHAHTMFKNFLRFLRENVFYDEVLAVNVAGQTGLWDVLQHLCSTRGMHIHVLEVLSKVLRSGGADSKLPEGPASKLAPTADAGMWLCASNPSLQQALLIRPPLARCHLQAVTTHLSTIEVKSLERLAALYDPSAPAVRPFLQKRLSRVHLNSESGSSCSITNDLSDYLLDANVNEEAVFPLDQLLHTFLLVLLQLALRRASGPSYDPRLVKRPPSPTSVSSSSPSVSSSPPKIQEEAAKVPLQHGAVSAGFAHVSLIRNGSVYTWGGAVLGCLGTGPTMSRYSTPQPIGVFPSLLVEVISVACGRQHTLALTNNGVYAWGSSQFGQLGIGSISQVPSPRLLDSLALEQVVAISAGQYHSLALTEDGRVFSWGWGVHGQLGHRSVEDEREPKLVERLTQQAIIQVSGGHGHSLVLGADGTVYTFGSNVFGQLGNGTSAKSTVPVRVTALPEPCVLVATGYFHNLVVSRSNKLYTWGSSPQVLRLQAQAQKKARLLQQQTVQASATAAAASAAASASATSAQTSFPSSQTGDNLLTSDNSSSSPSHLQNGQSKQTASSETSRNRTTNGYTNNATDAETREALKARLTLENIGESPRKTSSAAVDGSFGLSESLKSKVSTTPDVLFDEEFPEVAKLEVEELVAPGLPAIVVSPTVEFKGLSPPSVPTNTTSPSGAGATGSGTIETDEGQAHLLPQQVDLTQVVGTVAQIACGCHHSALLNSEGTLYVWGRNLDGQVGNGSRKEVPTPAPLGCTPTVSLKQATAVGGISNVLPGSVLDRACLQQVCCGCEFTVALEASGGRVWAWGSNAHAQLGFPPVEDSKPLEGKLVMLKTSKRVIKLPHGMHNSCDLPREVAGLPTPFFSYASSDSQAKSGSCPNLEGFQPAPLGKLEDPSYGLLTLHVALQRFYGLYDVKQLMAKCVELENYQAAARLAALERRYHVALAFQLQALAQCSSAEAGTVQSKEHATQEDDVHLKNDRNANRSNLNSARRNTKFRKEQIITDTEEVPTAKQDKQTEESELLGGRRCAPVGSCSSADVSPRRHIRGRPLAEQGRSASASSTPDSTRSSVIGDDAEMHTFSIQGGREQMSEGGRSLGSPDSGLSQATASPAHKPPSLSTPSVSGGEGRPTTEENKTNSSQSSCVSSSEKDKLAEKDTKSEEKEQPSSSNLIISPNPPEDHKNEGSSEKESSKKKPPGFDLVQEASALVEYYVSLMEEDSHTMMSQLLQQGFEFWLNHALPVEQLESLLLRHLPKFCYSLGLLLFCKGSGGPGDTGESQSSEPALLQQLSTRFCLQLCSVLLGHINQRKPHPEYLEALMRAAAAQGLNGCSGGFTSTLSPEQQLEVLLTGLRGMRAAGPGGSSQPYITLTQEDLRGCGLSNSERLLVFSCGHHYGSDTFEQTVLPELESALSQLSVPLPGTARLLKGAFRGGSPTLQLACPRCVISHIQSQVLA